MSKSINSESNFRDGFLEGAARAMFVMAYADHVENDEDSDLPRPSGGQDWYDFAPATPINAYALAGELWQNLCQLNSSNPYALAKVASAADGKHVIADEFGRLIAMQYMGTGVAWTDDHKDFGLKVGHCEVSAFTFDQAAYAEE